MVFFGQLPYVVDFDNYEVDSGYAYVGHGLCYYGSGYVSGCGFGYAYGDGHGSGKGEEDR